MLAFCKENIRLKNYDFNRHRFCGRIYSLGEPLAKLSFLNLGGDMDFYKTSVKLSCCLIHDCRSIRSIARQCQSEAMSLRACDHTFWINLGLQPEGAPLKSSENRTQCVLYPSAASANNSLRSSVFTAPSTMPRSLDASHWYRTGRARIVSGFRYFLRGFPVLQRSLMLQKMSLFLSSANATECFKKSTKLYTKIVKE